jgi:hypothetical protein
MSVRRVLFVVRSFTRDVVDSPAPPATCCQLPADICLDASRMEPVEERLGFT